MQECILGSLCFLVFLLSFSVAQNSVDLRTGFDPEDEFNSNAGHTYTNEDSGPFSGLHSDKYRSVLGEQNPYSSFDSYNPSYSLGSSFSDDAALSHSLPIPGGFRSNYASAEANANPEARAQLNINGPTYNLGNLEAGSSFPHSEALSYKKGPTLNVAQLNSDAEVTASGLSSSYSSSDTDALTKVATLDSGGYRSGNPAEIETQAEAQNNVFTSSHSSSIVSPEADAYSQAIGSRHMSGDDLALNQFSPGRSSANAQAIGSRHMSGDDLALNQFSPGRSSANAQAIASSYGSGSEFASATSSAQSQSLNEGSNLFGLGLGSSFANAQASSNRGSIQSRPIPREEYIMIPGVNNLISCSNPGELHNVWSEGYNCLICACVFQNGYLSPVCVSCDLCAIPFHISPLPPIDPPSRPLPPTPAPIQEVSCDPLPTNTPFQNPLNHCQICICQYSFGFEPDVRITCEDIPTCDIPQSDSIPPIPDSPTPVPLPTCERFPPNVVFPHPFDICQSCECVVVPNMFNIEHNIVCYQTPGCEPLLPTVPSLPPTSTPIPPMDPLPWPPLPPGPLPGPSPHKSCAPYPPNQQFQHPWDDCQICVCSEIYSTGVVNIEVNCFTNPVCCREYPGLGPYANQIVEHGSIPYEIEEIPGSNVVFRPQQSTLSQLKYLDNMCRSRSIGEDFLYDRCRICTCQIFGNMVVPVCKRAYMPECVNMPAPVPVGNIVYLEPKCRIIPPLQTFISGCNSCQCQSVFNFVIANCKPVPGCDKGQSQYYQANTADAYANSQVGSYNYGTLGYHPSSSMAEANAAATLGSSGISEYGGYSSLGYPHNTKNSQSLAQANAIATAGSSGIPEYGGYPSLSYPHNIQNSQSLAEANAIATSGSSGIPEYGGYPSFSYPHNIKNSQSFAEANAVTTSGLSGIPEYGGYPSLSYPHNIQNSQSFAEANAIATSGSSGISGGYLPRPLADTQMGSHGYPHGFQTSQSSAAAKAISGSKSLANSQAGSHTAGSTAQSNAAAFSGLLEGSKPMGGSGFAGYPLTPTSSGYSYAHAESQANANSGSNGLNGVLPYRPYNPYSRQGATGSYSHAASEAETFAALTQRSNVQQVPFNKPGIVHQNGIVDPSIADTMPSHVFGLPQLSVLLSPRSQIKSGDPEEVVEFDEKK